MENVVIITNVALLAEKDPDIVFTIQISKC